MVSRSKEDVQARTQQAMDYFQSKGWTREQAAGIVGNLTVESAGTMDPSITGGYMGRAEGIAQWLGSRKEDFKKVYGVSPNQATFEQQLDFIQIELNGKEKGAAAALRQATTPSEAAQIFEQKYERANGQLIDHRIKAANNLYAGGSTEYTGPVSSSTPSAVAASSVRPPAAKTNSAPPKLNGKTGVGNVVTLSNTPGAIGEEAPATKQVNVLEKFSSFNSIFTLSLLTKEQVNFPDTSYKKGELGNIVLRSGGGRPDNRVKTAYSSSYNKDGKFDFFIDNIKIEGIVSYNKKTQGSNSTSVAFEVFEPYSIGLFLQALKLASMEAGFPNYNQAPLLLTIEFVGYDSNGNVVPSDDTLDRHLPIKLSNIEMKVNASGCTYQVEATPWNELALADQFARFTQDMVVTGKTVQEILQNGPNSLQLWLNGALADVRKNEKPQNDEGNPQGEGKATKQTNKSKAVPNEIAIIFPEVLDSASAGQNSTETSDSKPVKADPKTISASQKVEGKLTLTRNDNQLLEQKNGVNEIGKSILPFTAASGGTGAQPKSDETKSEDGRTLRKANYYDPALKEFRFPQGTSVIAAISEIMLMSKYCQDNVKTDVPGKPGMVKWFRVETQAFVLDPTEESKQTGETPKLLVYRVVPYYVHRHHFMAPTNQPDYSTLAKSAIKEYNYIYSGKNVDILNFDITINNAAFTTLYADRNNNAGDLYPSINKAADSEGRTGVSVKTAPVGSDDQLGNPAIGAKYKGDSSKIGGPPDDPKTLVARNFHQALMANSEVDMVELKLEIMGDPYFIADSGMGNFSDKAVNANLNKGGTINYQSGEVDVIVNFRTPVDYNPSTGYVDFGPTEIVQGFSGLYRVTELTNTFSKGKFTQELSLLRRPNQNVKAAETPKPSTTAPAEVDNGAPLTTTPEEKKAATTKQALDTKPKGDSSSLVDLWSSTKKFFGF